MSAERVTKLTLEAGMSIPLLTDAAVALLCKPNPAVITTLRRDGQPVSTATWYLWEKGRVLVNMDEARKRLAHMRNDPRVALDVLDEGDWYTHLGITGHVEEMRADAGLADIDRLARHYTGKPFRQRDRRRISAWIAVDGWHGWGALEDGSQPG
jgi:PPOX class probable F420-dependent enzyme